MIRRPADQAGPRSPKSSPRRSRHQAVFRQIEPRTPIAETVNAAPQFDKWRSIDTEVLVTGRVTPASNGRWKAEFRLWDMASGKLLLAQQYSFGPEGPREIPHQIAAAIMERFGR